ncbi:MAG TPA: SDR family oxidoreductase [Gemmatimonadaceae bacterium]|jgi:NADP-dependent 3-hydroxy acid dehydrogenase YdfG
MSSQVVVITGASEGIGAAIARRLGSDGFSVVLAARREQMLREVAAQSGTNTLVVPTDVTKRDQVERLRDRAISKFGSVDIWINNAGRGITRPVLELSDEDFDAIMAVNVKSALYGMQAIVPHFIERESGHLINISSFLGRVPVATHRSAYNAAKAALNALTANLRVDLRTRYPGIHVSLVMPGLVSTKFAEHVIGAGGARPWTPSGQMVAQTPDEVANVVAQVIARPVAEVYTIPGTAAVAQKYYADVAAFEAGNPR